MMQNQDKLLIQVVPRLTPTRCGVSDHAITLARELKSSFGIDSAFVVANSEERCDLPYRVEHCSAIELLEACRALAGKRDTSVLVHVSGYGYSFDGAPKALADALVKVHEFGEFPLAGYFHELYATGAPWKSAFWYSLRQRREVRRIAELCSLVMTNTSQHASWLQNAKTPIAELRLMPVFSNVGECAQLVPWRERNPALIVFGQSGTRRRAYDQLSRILAVCRRLGIREIIDIGADASVPATLGGLPVRRMGRMASAELATLMAATRFGFVRFVPKEIAKSSVMATLCAFGTVPVLAQTFPGETDGLSDGRQLITPNTVGSACLEDCSREAWNWYQHHSVTTHARMYSEWIGTGKSREVVAG